MIMKRFVDPDGSVWVAHIDYDGHVHITKNGRRWDSGWDDGTIIHHADRTPAHVLDGLNAAESK